VTKKQEKTPLTKTWINIHKNFLQQFDTQTKNNYSSRNEAIRHGMKLVLIELTNYKINKPQHHTNTIHPQQQTTLRGDTED
jgi:metal-responsive CopG/Arc/MetJ family transcriptional regulator